uniref:Uncharacterized protein n=1 Tax=Strigamia maritima TaxID=126957 RepID=T1IPE3_STRMM
MITTLFSLSILMSTTFCSNSILWRTQFNSSRSLINSKTPTHCLLTNTYLRTSSETFYVGLDNVQFLDVCSDVRDKWSFQLKNRDNKSGEFSCDQVFQRGYVFTLDSFRVDILVSLFVALRSSKESSKTVVFMPSVRKDWATDLFLDDDSWWMHFLKIIVEPYKILPFDTRLAAMQKTMCFKQLVSEVPKVNFTRDLVHGFVALVKQYLHINQTSHSDSNLVIISSNVPVSLVQEARIVTPVQLMDVQKMTFEDQVNLIQNAVIFVGSELDLNIALFLPPKSIFLRIVSQTSKNSSLSDLLRKRGPNIEWRLEENKSQEFGEVLTKIQRHCKID